MNPGRPQTSGLCGICWRLQVVRGNTARRWPLDGGRGSSGPEVRPADEGALPREHPGGVPGEGRASRAGCRRRRGGAQQVTQQPREGTEEAEGRRDEPGGAAERLGAAPGADPAPLRAAPLNHTERVAALHAHILKWSTIGLDLQEIARRTEGLNNKDLCALVKAASWEAADLGDDGVYMKHFEQRWRQVPGCAAVGACTVCRTAPAGVQCGGRCGRCWREAFEQAQKRVRQVAQQPREGTEEAHKCLGRKGFKRVVFQRLDLDRDGRLRSLELLPFARAMGFVGSDEDWAEDYELFCAEIACSKEAGLSEGDFGAMVDDKRQPSCFGYSTNGELWRFLRQVPGARCAAGPDGGPRTAESRSDGSVEPAGASAAAAEGVPVPDSDGEFS